MSDRQLRSDAKNVRESSVSADAIHLASAQEFAKCGNWDAHFIVNDLAKNPELGTFLRKALKSKDSKSNSNWSYIFI